MHITFGVCPLVLACIVDSSKSAEVYLLCIQHYMGIQTCKNICENKNRIRTWETYQWETYDNGKVNSLCDCEKVLTIILTLMKTNEKQHFSLGANL